MKWLSGGLTFVNFATICGLFIGMFAGGLSTAVAWGALILAVGFALLAYLRTTDPESQADAVGSDKSKIRKYRSLPIWILAGLFAIFAVRSFCWLLFVDGTELKIQSPVNLGDLGLHITHISLFANGVRLWPSNPIYVFSHHLRYPAGIDLFNALLLKIDVDLIRGLVWVGLSLYASMPLFHLHTFMALSIVLVCLFVAGDPQIRGHILTLVLSALIPATFFVWLISDHFLAGSVLEFHPGWAQNEGEFRMSFFRFWFFNFGILVPLVLTLIGLIAWQLYQSHQT